MVCEMNVVAEKLCRSYSAYGGRYVQPHGCAPLMFVQPVPRLKVRFAAKVAHLLLNAKASAPRKLWLISRSWRSFGRRASSGRKPTGSLSRTSPSWRLRAVPKRKAPAPVEGNPNMVQELLLREQQEDEDTEKEVRGLATARTCRRLDRCQGDASRYRCRRRHLSASGDG